MATSYPHQMKNPRGWVETGSGVHSPPYSFRRIGRAIRPLSVEGAGSHQDGARNHPPFSCRRSKITGRPLRELQARRCTGTSLERTISSTRRLMQAKKLPAHQALNLVKPSG